MALWRRRAGGRARRPLRRRRRRDPRRRRRLIGSADLMPAQAVAEALRDAATYADADGGGHAAALAARGRGSKSRPARSTSVRWSRSCNRLRANAAAAAGDGDAAADGLCGRAGERAQPRASRIGSRRCCYDYGAWLVSAGRAGGGGAAARRGARAVRADGRGRAAGPARRDRAGRSDERRPGSSSSPGRAPRSDRGRGLRKAHVGDDHHVARVQDGLSGGEVDRVVTSQGVGSASSPARRASGSVSSKPASSDHRSTSAAAARRCWDTVTLRERLAAAKRLEPPRAVPRTRRRRQRHPKRRQ